MERKNATPTEEIYIPLLDSQTLVWSLTCKEQSRTATRTDLYNFLKRESLFFAKMVQKQTCKNKLPMLMCVRVCTPAACVTNFFSSHYTTPAECWAQDLARGLNSSSSSWVHGCARMGQTSECNVTAFGNECTFTNIFREGIIMHSLMGRPWQRWCSIMVDMRLDQCTPMNWRRWRRW